MDIKYFGNIFNTFSDFSFFYISYFLLYSVLSIVCEKLLGKIFFILL